jgi:hypothetical protein
VTSPLKSIASSRVPSRSSGIGLSFVSPGSSSTQAFITLDNPIAPSWDEVSFACILCNTGDLYVRVCEEPAGISHDVFAAAIVLATSSWKRRSGDHTEPEEEMLI